MKTYDEIIGFDYTSAGEWRDFVEKQMLPLHKSVSKIIKLREDLEQLLGNNLSDLIKDDISIKQILLGGVDERGEYKPNSLSKLYKEVLGISINPKEWVSLCRYLGTDASEYIKCDFSDTAFLQFIKVVKDYVDNLLPIVEVSSTEVDDGEIRGILENPERIMDELKAIYTHLINISANHSYHTFFTLNTRCIPRYYIEQAYPKLKDDFKSVAEFLGLEAKFTPDIEKKEIKRDYTLWGHKENGFADLVYTLNGIIWENFRKEGLRNIFELIAIVEDLNQKYREKVDRELNRIGWNFPDYIHPHKWGGARKPYWHREYEIKSAWLSKCYEVPSWSRYSEHEVKFDGKSLMELFNDVSPALLLGKIDYKNEKYAEHQWSPFFKNISEYTLEIKSNRLRIEKRDN